MVANLDATRDSVPELRREPPARSSLRAVLLLAGGSRRTQLSPAGRSPLELPVRSDVDVLGALLAELQTMVAPPIDGFRVVVGGVVSGPGRRDEANVTVETDPRPLRGTGGLLRDTTSAYAPEDIVLVGNGLQVLRPDGIRRAERLVDEVARGGVEVVIGAGESGAMLGMMAMRCSSVRGLAEEGFVDFKEQVLPQLAKQKRVAVLKFDGPGDLPIRTLAQYLEAVRFVRDGWGMPDPLAALDPFSQPGGRRTSGTAGRLGLDAPPPTGVVRSVVEEGAWVAEGARVVDSVLLSGARVEAGALVVRSLVGSGAVIPAGSVKDAVVGRDGATVHGAGGRHA